MQPRDFSRDMRSFSRPRNTSRGRSGSTGNRKMIKGVSRKKIIESIRFVYDVSVNLV